jgi:hypothetical protein
MAEILDNKDLNLNMTSHLICAAVKKCPCGLDVYRENINDKGTTSAETTDELKAHNIKERDYLQNITLLT